VNSKKKGREKAFSNEGLGEGELQKGAKKERSLHLLIRAAIKSKKRAVILRGRNG